MGEGPFTVEYFGDQAHALREAGGEYGAATGRPRRVGPFDAVASRYGIRMQGADEIALTKLDVLTGLGDLEVCVAYERAGERTEEFPFPSVLDDYKPVYVTLPGWTEDISSCKKAADLPENARNYIRFLEEKTNCRIRYVSVGAEREQYIDMNE